MSPMLRLAPSTKTGKYTLQPLDRFLMSQFPPFSRPGICTWLEAAAQDALGVEGSASRARLLVYQSRVADIWILHARNSCTPRSLGCKTRRDDAHGVVLPVR